MIKLIFSSSELILFVLILFSLTIQFGSLILISNHFIKNHIKYLNSLTTIKPGELKTDTGRSLIYTLISNLKTMKKFIGWSILIVVLAIIGIAGVIVIDSRVYFKQYFEKQRTELNLRSEKSVDSLLKVIGTERKQKDSLFLVTQGLYERDSLKNETLKELKKQITWLHQQNVNVK